MSQNAISLLALTMTATGTIAQNRFVTPAGAQAGNGVATQGVARIAAVAADKFTVHVMGTAIVESGAAIAAGAAIQSDASGRAITLAAGVQTGRLAPGESSTAAGQMVEVILIPN